MKKFATFILLFVIFTLNAQIYPLNTYTKVPNNAYIKDIDNELLPYVGTWKGTWDNKVIYIYLQRYKKQQSYNDNHFYYKDVLIGRFKVLNATETTVLFDNTNLSDDDTKIEGLRFLSVPITRYSLFYIDQALCDNGIIEINMVNSTNTQLQWKYGSSLDMVSESNCTYVANNLPIPKALPTNIILTKQ